MPRILSPRLSLQGFYRPGQAVIWAAFFNFVAFLIFSTTVAETIGKGMVDIKAITPTVVLAGLGEPFHGI